MCVTQNTNQPAMKRISNIIILSAMLLGIYLLALTACRKTNNITEESDRLLRYPYCFSCDSGKARPLNSWYFRVNGTYACGPVDTGFVFADLTGFTFWGHTQCSRDTGFEISAILHPTSLATNRFNIRTNNVILWNQDRLLFTNFLNSMILRLDHNTPKNSMQLTVDTFLVSSRLLVGHFNGYAYTSGDEKMYLDGGFRLAIPR